MVQWIMLVVGHIYAQRRESARADSEYGERRKLSSRALRVPSDQTLSLAASHEPEDSQVTTYLRLACKQDTPAPLESTHQTTMLLEQRGKQLWPEPRTRVSGDAM